VTQHDLNELTPGLSQQADVQALIGPPTFVEQFDQNNWVYVSQTTKMRIGQTEGLKNQHVVVMTFNGNGTLQTVSQKTMKDAVRVSMDSKHTPVPGGHAGFIQQLVGGPISACTSACWESPGVSSFRSCCVTAMPR
jgi:outer membrane protein assembly factor BamE (lipoprotein component of BamABCDE complex)